MKVDGGCRCGQINLAAEVASGAIGDCIDGQPRAGFAFRTVVPTKAVALRLLAGESRIYVALGAVRSVLCQPASSYEPADRQRSPSSTSSECSAPYAHAFWHRAAGRAARSCCPPYAPRAWWRGWHR